MSAGLSGLRGLRRYWERLGRPGQAGLGMVAVAALLALGVTPSFTRQAAELDRQAEQQGEQLRLRRVQALAAETSNPAKSRARQAQLPGIRSQQERLLSLHEAALRSGLQAVRSEHRQSQDEATGLQQLRVSLPVRGQYLQVRAFVDAALLADAGLALDSMRLRRVNAASVEVEGELQFSLYSAKSEVAP